MRIITLFSAAATLAVGFAGAASAQSTTGQCFDKATLRYVPCPRPIAPAPLAPVAPIVDDEGFYIGARGGVIFPIDEDLGGLDAEFDMGYAVGGEIGYDFGEVTPGLGLRTELEGGYQQADLERAGLGGDATTLYGFANLYGDIGLTQSLDLIVGGGAGLGQVEVDTGAGSDDDIAFGYHLDAGLGYDITPQFTVEALYRWSSFLGAETTVGGVAEEFDFTSHQALVGGRYRF